MAKKIITKQAYEVIHNIRLSMEKVLNSLNERNVVLSLIGDLRTMILFNSNSETIADVSDFKKTLMTINNKLTELTGTTVNEGNFQICLSFFLFKSGHRVTFKNPFYL